MATKIGEYKGHKTISLLRNGGVEEKPFSFGLGKAKLILDNIDEIRSFVEENYVERPKDSEQE